MRGKYIVFEGPDGSGKTTLAKMLVAALRVAQHQRVRFIAFPNGESAVGRLIRHTFEGRETVSPDAMMWLFVADGKDAEREIQRHITEGDWVICDRHTQVSGRIYQAEVHGVDHVDQVTEPAHFIVPDRIYLIDVPATVAMERRKARGEARNALYEPDQLERLESMCRTYRAQKDRFAASALVDGTKPLHDNLRWMWHDLGFSGEPPAP